MSISPKSKINNGEPDELHSNGNGHHLNPGWFLSDKSSVLLDSIPSAMVYVDKNQLVQYANKAFERIFDVDPKTLCQNELGLLIGARDNLEGKCTGLRGIVLQTGFMTRFYVLFPRSLPFLF